MGALFDLVLKLFSVAEFRRWLGHGPDADIIPELLGEATAAADFVDTALQALDRRGRIDADFFVRLTLARDRQREAIAVVAALWVKSPRATAEATDITADRAADRTMKTQSRVPVEPPASRSASPSGRDAPIGPAVRPRTEARSPDSSGAARSTSWTARGSTVSSSSREVVLASWIHVSDLHFGHGAVGYQWNQVRVLGELVNDARGLVKDAIVPQPDFVFVTGDVAFSGGARTPATGGSEYQLAANWIAELQLALEIPRECVFVVPGNHDVDRGADRDLDVSAMIELARDHKRRHQLDDVFSRPDRLARLRGRMARYLAFARGYGPRASDRLHDGLWWRSRVDLNEGVSLRLCGLNTALLAADEHDKGQLRVGERQLAELFDPAPGDQEITVVLGHHPAIGRWLADEKEVRGPLERHGAIHLFGHLHAADSAQTRHGWGGGCLRIAAGAAHAEAASGDAPPVGHGYNFGALVLLASGEIAVRIWPRRWSTTAPRFVVDVDNTGDRRDFAEYRLPDRYRIYRPVPRSGVRPDLVLGDRYRLISDIGQGGVGQVWRALDEQTGATVAVKILNPDGARRPEGRRESFFRGAQVMARLDHPAIARVLDPRPDPENRFSSYDFYVMDFIDAPSLSAAYRKRPRSDAETIEILLAIGEGVAAAHGRSVIHCDLKPSNILRDEASGRVVIIDFDTAKDLGSLTVTRSGEGLASTFYASPEVLTRLNPPPGGAPRPDARADIFSLAVIGIFLRTGRNPSHFHMSAVIESIECAPGLRSVLTKGCAHVAAERYGSVGEFLAALREIQLTEDVRSTVSPLPRREGAWLLPPQPISPPQPPPRADGHEGNFDPRGDGDWHDEASGSPTPRTPADARPPVSPGRRFTFKVLLVAVSALGFGRLLYGVMGKTERGDIAYSQQTADSMDDVNSKVTTTAGPGDVPTSAVSGGPDDANSADRSMPLVVATTGGTDDASTTLAISATGGPDDTGGDKATTLVVVSTGGPAQPTKQTEVQPTKQVRTQPTKRVRTQPTKQDKTQPTKPPETQSTTQPTKTETAPEPKNTKLTEPPTSKPPEPLPTRRTDQQIQDALEQSRGDFKTCLIGKGGNGYEDVYASFKIRDDGTVFGVSVTVSDVRIQKSVASCVEEVLRGVQFSDGVEQSVKPTKLQTDG